MSTRCVINFTYGKEPSAKIYRHYDGYPVAVEPDLERFFRDVEAQTEDTRFTDASYLAAKFVVWQAHEYSDQKGNLDFLGVGVIVEDPGDIEFIYTVDCGKMTKDRRPTVSYEPL